VHPDLLLPKVKDKIFVIVSTISPFGKPSERAFLFPLIKIKIMNTPDINTIAFQYLLRTDSQKNNNAEESTSKALQYNPEQHMKNQKSLLFEMYAAEDEALFI
jgi:hypothetical protein